ncbi:hypothetical protein SAMN02745216_04791 [Desulfatibacillum alkenivorans DSM 16219]|jgi:hypothetical protein|uniref:Uncharacterized protein n=1 Tax=Desulfatibacillum alkenivorans DSM 16219 TaxID=1121393 RepID=A0A1M6YP01_9BACT|nr:hypothetical protein [Desulfatibacillum alkenivorans]SHL19739.1 hypothetical protein SAMN02745216_04791 [Desulfatibacillum alkenivorans DSM 16219]
MQRKWKMTGLAMVCALALAAGSAYAGPVGKVQARQMGRIHQGVKSGQLTPGEARALAHQQRMIRQTKRAFLCDGRLVPYERAVLRNMQQRASANIAWKKHNGRHR